MENTTMSDREHEDATAADHRSRHPLCRVCDTACCVSAVLGRYCGDCHEAEFGIVAHGTKDVYVHAGQCGAIWHRARAVELIDGLMADVTNGLLVLQARGVPITDEQVVERARNIVAGLIGNYEIKAHPLRPPVTAHDFASEGRIRS